MSLGVYRFHWSARGGDLFGIFVSSAEDVAEIIGKRIYLGEVLGKHSEVYGTIMADEITLVTDDQDAVKIFLSHAMETGYNPFGYLPDPEDGDYD